MKIKTAKEIAAIQKSGKVVINASRRTDIPAFHVDELMDGLRKGAFHPQELMQSVWEFRFAPEDIHSVGLWSQNFGPWIERRGEVKHLGYKFWYRFSILPDDPVCKPKAPAVTEQLAQLERLAETDGPDTVFLFVDPLVKYRKLGAPGWKYNFSEESLGQIFQKAKEVGIASVSTSILDYYKKVEQRVAKAGVEFGFLNPEDTTDQQEMIGMIRTVKDVADRQGLILRTCCEKFLHSSGLSLLGACVDGKRLNELFGPGASILRDNAQRRKYGCGCTASVDIGRYIDKGEWSHFCGNECLQCYARP